MNPEMYISEKGKKQKQETNNRLFRWIGVAILLVSIILAILGTINDNRMAFLVAYFSIALSFGSFIFEFKKGKDKEIQSKDKEIQSKDKEIQSRDTIIQNFNKKEQEIENAYENGLLSEVISKARDASNHEKLDGGVAKKKYRHFLEELMLANRLNPIELTLGDTKYINLFDAKSTLSITDAPLFAWKNPEYNWFLISNYTAVLLNRLKKEPQKKLCIIDREDAVFIDFLKKGARLLKKVSNGTLRINDNIRFYFLDKNEVINNKAMVGQMIAGHDLFGIHLFVINKKILEEPDISNHYHGLTELSIFENDVIDVMLYTNSKNENMVKYPKDGKLEEELLENIRWKTLLKSFIQVLAGLLIERPDFLIYPPTIKNGKEKTNNLPYFVNKKKTHLSIQ